MVYNMKTLMINPNIYRICTENSPDIQTLIKKLHDLIYERKVSLAEAYKETKV